MDSERLNQAQKGDVHYFNRYFDDAVREYSTGIESNPDNAGLYYRRALSYVQLRDYDNAIVDLSKAIEMGPNLKEFYYVRGMLFEARKEYSKALWDYEKVAELVGNGNN
ncbi:MAG: tetratricopeptide repeat protein [Candidatus Altiarchaeota archaeon]